MQGDPTVRLRDVLMSLPRGAIAVSGGVDSMTLSSYAHSLLGFDSVRMVHAVSPAVPRAATERVRAFAGREGWNLTEVDAGEFGDPRYRANPVDRCFFCKSHLYETLSGLCKGLVLSGTNCDDLGDYRPGLKAAANNAVRHPYVEAGMTKDDVRHLARQLGLADLAELPASPCLSSRVETGIPIEAARLSLIDAVETWLRTSLRPKVVRCRLRHTGIVIELDRETLDGLTAAQRSSIIEDATAYIPETELLDVSLAIYRQGSAFIGARMSPAE